jgi:hypothetical protein
MARIHSCNVLQVRPESVQLWRFAANNGDVYLTFEQTGMPADQLPARLIGKDWRALWQRKLNLAWVPVHQVFLRVVHLPTSDPSELQSMVELQLERLSPLPVAQIVWSYEVEGGPSRKPYVAMRLANGNTLITEGAAWATKTVEAAPVRTGSRVRRARDSCSWAT